MLTYILFVIGFFFLIKGADILVDGASSVAKKFNLSPIFIGLTIVAFGTSAPELIVNLLASASGNTEIAIGNIVGSNIANVFFILGISAMIYPLTTKFNTVYKEIPLNLLAAIVLAVMVNDVRLDGFAFSGLSRTDGFTMICFFIIFLYYTFAISTVTGDAEADEIKELKPLKSAIYIVLGLLGLVVGGKWIVDGAVALATLFSLSESLIGLTVVAIGTSLPELATSVVAARKKQSDIAIGNVVGSGIFNIFLILGTSSIIRPLPFSQNSDLDIVMVVFASLLLFLAMFVGKKHTLERWQGFVFVLIYFSYLAFLVVKDLYF